MMRSRAGTTSATQARARPFLKWAGGKRQLLPELRKYYPATFDKYFEPFLGSGAVFFDLYNAGLLGRRQVVLLDNNPDLIGCYSVLRRDPESVIRELEQLAREYAATGTPFFYRVRDSRFNPARHRLFGVESDPVGRYTAELAAMLIFLNRTGFNGLFRLNSEGRFNVPEGRYEAPRICDAENLRTVSRALNDTNVTVTLGDFDQVEALASRHDFLYFDPPYAPVSRTSSFTSYTARPFDALQQQQLHALVLELSRRGCHIVVSNSTAVEIRKLYGAAATRAARLRPRRVRARRAINSKGSRRGPVDEYILANTRTEPWSVENRRGNTAPIS